MLHSRNKSKLSGSMKKLFVADATEIHLTTNLINSLASSAAAVIYPTTKNSCCLSLSSAVMYFVVLKFLGR